jgi:hypothetical protein
MGVAAHGHPEEIPEVGEDKALPSSVATERTAALRLAWSEDSEWLAGGIPRSDKKSGW